MKFVIFSDIHGNLKALQAMLEGIKGQSLDGYIFCGDLAGYKPDQEGIVEIFNGLDNFYSVLGNHDIWYLAALKNRLLQRDLAQKGLGSSYGCPSEKVGEFLQKQPLELKLEICGKRVGVFHNMPAPPTERRLIPDAEVDEKMFEGYDIAFLGHTHLQMQRVIGSTLVVNPGSLGNSRFGAKQSYAIFDFDKEVAQIFEIDEELLK